MQVRGPIERQLGILVGVVADKILGADSEHIGTELELGRERVVTTELHLMTWNAREIIARLTNIFPSAWANGLFGEDKAAANW